MRRREFSGDNKVKLVTVLLPKTCIEGLEDLVRRDMYPSRSAAIRAAVRDLLRQEVWFSPLPADERSIG